MELLVLQSTSFLSYQIILVAEMTINNKFLVVHCIVFPNNFDYLMIKSTIIIAQVLVGNGRYKEGVANTRC